MRLTTFVKCLRQRYTAARMRTEVSAVPSTRPPRRRPRDEGAACSRRCTHRQLSFDTRLAVGLAVKGFPLGYDNAYHCLPILALYVPASRTTQWRHK
jgi:hypothetical protein